MAKDNKEFSNFRDLLLSQQQGFEVYATEFKGRPMRFMIMDPTIDDNHWWQSEVLAANPEVRRKNGAWTLPADALPDIILKCTYYPLDYGQIEPEKSDGADPALAGKPVFDEADKTAIGNSTLNLFNDIANKWLKRMQILYPIKTKDDAKN